RARASVDAAVVDLDEIAIGGERHAARIGGGRRSRGSVGGGDVGGLATGGQRGIDAEEPPRESLGSGGIWPCLRGNVEGLVVVRLAVAADIGHVGVVGVGKERKVDVALAARMETKAHISSFHCKRPVKRSPAVAPVARPEQADKLGRRGLVSGYPRRLAT